MWISILFLNRSCSFCTLCIGFFREIWKISNNFTLSSPRTWGCFPQAQVLHAPTALLPTHVGVFLKLPQRCTSGSPPPHARGGVSPTPASPASSLCSSPRTWGCFQGAPREPQVLSLLPTHVGCCSKRNGHRAPSGAFSCGTGPGAAQAAIRQPECLIPDQHSKPVPLPLCHKNFILWI